MPIFQVQTFLQVLERELTAFRSFKIRLYDTKLFLNDASTRSFMALLVSTGAATLKRIIDALNNHVLKQFRLPEFYDNPILHASFAVHEGRISRIPVCQQYDAFQVNVTQIYCRAGDQTYCFNLD